MLPSIKKAPEFWLIVEQSANPRYSKLMVNIELLTYIAPPLSGKVLWNDWKIEFETWTKLFISGATGKRPPP